MPYMNRVLEILQGSMEWCVDVVYSVDSSKGAFLEMGKLVDIAANNFIEFHNLDLKVCTTG